MQLQIDDDKAQKWADEKRAKGLDLPRRSRGTFIDDLLADIMEAFPPKPKLRVGYFAEVVTDGQVAVLGVGAYKALLRTLHGDEFAYPIAHLTPTDEPVPEDWGQQ